jgi:hypothetical protein
MIIHRTGTGNVTRQDDGESEIEYDIKEKIKIGLMRT